MQDIPNVVTVTLNPAIDQSVFVDELRPGSVHRVQRSQRQAGGKGVNVATMLSLGGVCVTVSGFLGEDNAQIFEQHFRTHQLTDAFIRVAGETRVGIKILDSKSGTTDLNFPGIQPDAQALSDLKEGLLGLCGADVWFVFGGSLPAGMRVAGFEALLATLKDAGAKLAVDSSGAALKAAIDAGVDLIKPNEHELAEALGLPDTKPETVIRAVDGLMKKGLRSVILSMGEAGALFVSEGEKILAKSPPIEVISTVGAGDSLLAGYLAGLVQGLPLGERARMATAYAWNRLVSLDPKLDEMEERMAAVCLETRR